MDKRVRRTRQAFREAIIALMEEKKFKDISVTDIVTRADYSRAAFYTHFKDKEALLKEVTEEVLDDLSRAYEEPYHEVRPFQIATLQPENIKIFQHVTKHKKFYRVVVEAGALPDFQKLFTSRLKKLFLDDFNNREETDPLEKDLAAAYQAYALYGMIIEWVEGGFRYSADHMARQLLLILRTKET